MNFDYIKSASSCEPSCQQTGESGNPTGMPILGDPPPGTTGGDGIAVTPLTNVPVTGYGDTTALGKEINCVSAEIIFPEATIVIGESYGFTLKVKKSNGITYAIGGSSGDLHIVWSSSDDEIATIANPTHQTIGAQGYANYFLGKAAGEVTVSAHFTSPSGQTRIGRLPTENWFGACDLTVTAKLTVTTGTPPDRCNPVLPGILDLTKVLRLEITPRNSQSDPYAIAEVGVVQKLGAVLTLTNGDVVDVSELVTWSSSDPTIVEIDCFGNATAVAAGEAVILVELPGINNSGTIVVVPPASQASRFGNTWTVTPIDTVIVLDRSASMNLRDQDGATRVERARQAALSFLANSAAEPESQLALVTFAGIWLANETPGGTPQTEADATTDLTLTTDVSEIRQALAEFQVRGPCPLLEGEGSRCATGIGGGLLAAQRELESERHSYGHKGLVVLLTDGCNNVALPDYMTVADELKTAGFLITVIALDTPLCAVDLEAIASPGLYFSSPTVYELSFILGQLNFQISYGEYGYGFYE